METMTPKEIIEAVQAGTPLIAPRCGEATHDKHNKSDDTSDCARRRVQKIKEGF